MRTRFVVWIILVLALSSPSFGQDEEYDQVKLRITSTPTASVVLVDRGSGDGLEIGDIVIFEPRGAPMAQGSVSGLEERSATVELIDKSVVLLVGTRGMALIPRVRLAPPPEAPPPVEKPGDGQADAVEFENKDEGFYDGLPLLAEIQAGRPRERAPLVTGRLYFIGDQTITSQENRSDAFLRFGQSLRIANPFKRGGGLRIDLEQNYRNTDIPFDRDVDTAFVRVDRLSYFEGGDRFNPRRWEAGRFLQHIVPEFGLVDGFEYTQRLANGDSVGGSLGFQPEPFDRLQSGSDFQFSAYYRWVADSTERLSATGAFQQSLHNGAADRSLFLAKLQYLPVDGWDFNGTAWIDVYSGSDAINGPGLELTQAFLSTSKRWDSGDGINITLNHWRFPEIQRTEFLLPVADQIARARNTRLAFSGWRQVAVDQQAHAEVGIWDDDEETGGDGAAGIAFSDLVGNRSRLDVTVFGSSGRFSSLLGARAQYNKYVPGGRWDLFYEVAQNDQDGFNADQDNFIQHRIRATRNMNWVSGWNLSVFAESLLWADEESWSLGVYLQKSF